MNINTHVEKVTAAIAAHQSILDDASIKAAEAKSQFEAAQAADAQTLTPIAEAAGNLQRQLNTLTHNRENLTMRLLKGRRQLEEQKIMVGQIEELWAGSFGQPYATDGDFGNVVQTRPFHFVALQMVPRLSAWIAEKESELLETEAAIAALADAAKPPTL
jgi:hypothetical protein